MTPDQIKFFTIIEEMRTPVTHIRGWVEHIQSESRSPMTDDQRQLFSILQSRIVQLQENLATIVESRLVPVDDTMLGMVVIELAGLINLIQQAADMISDIMEKTPPDLLPDWSTDLENIKTASASVYMLHQSLRPT